MKDVIKQLEVLLNKPQWTEEENLWFQDYLENGDSNLLKDLLQRHFEEELQPNQTFRFSMNVSRQMLQGIHKKLGIHPDEARKKPVVRMWFTRLAAAALVVGIIVLAAYFFNSQNGNSKTQTTVSGTKTRENDVLPGGNKAVLTLADGSTIILDDAQDGNVAQQGNTRIFKVAGKLAYSAASDNKELLYNTISTPRGGQYQIELPDGSLVWLNAASSLRFPSAFVGNERKVSMTGEAYFEIAKSRSMPFVVTVDDAEIRVLGTHFNVMAYNEEPAVKTTLLQGAVKFESGFSSCLLKPGQQAKLSKEGQLKVADDANLEEVMAWKNGNFHFEGASIETVMGQLSRWYNVDVTYNKSISDLFYLEMSRNTKLSDVLKVLELAGNLKFKIEGKKITVSP